MNTTKKNGLTRLSEIDYDLKKAFSFPVTNEVTDEFHIYQHKITKEFKLFRISHAWGESEGNIISEDKAYASLNYYLEEANRRYLDSVKGYNGKVYQYGIDRDRKKLISIMNFVNFYNSI